MKNIILLILVSLTFIVISCDSSNNDLLKSGDNKCLQGDVIGNYKCTTFGN